MHDEPLAPYPAIDIRHAHGQIQGLPIAHGTADALDTVSIAEAAHGGGVVLADIRKRGNLNRPAERHGQADALEGRRVASATRRR